MFSNYEKCTCKNVCNFCKAVSLCENKRCVCNAVFSGSDAFGIADACKMKTKAKESFIKSLTENEAQKLEGFVHCPNPKCKFSCVVIREGLFFECKDCKLKICSYHLVSHEGVSCTDFETVNNNEKKSISYINNMKKCPSCHIPIEKSIFGCEHMTCKCGHQFCWLCFQPFSTTKRTGLSCIHADSCPKKPKE